jgi:hypothetical protein
MMVAISEREKQVSDVGRDDIAVRGNFLIKVAGWLQRYDERVFFNLFLMFFREEETTPKSPSSSTGWKIARDDCLLRITDQLPDYYTEMTSLISASDHL